MENKYPKISLQDIVKNNKLSPKETLEIKEKVDALNKFIEENPEYIEYLQKRYPKNDPRLSQLRHKLDGMTSASNEYVERQFPENKRLFNEVQKSIKRNIKLTDPKTFKNVEDAPSFNKLLSVDYINQNELPKKKLKLQSRNKKTAARFLKKSAMDLIDSKIIQLEKDIKKLDSNNPLFKPSTDP
jgi:hypothetical protein